MWGIITDAWHRYLLLALKSISLALSFYLSCCNYLSWWRNDMGTLSALLPLCDGNPPLTDGFPPQRVGNTGFDVLFDVRLNRRLNTQASCWWFETMTPIWRRRNVVNLCGQFVIRTFSLKKNSIGTCVQNGIRFVPPVRVLVLPWWKQERLFIYRNLAMEK